MEDRVSLHMPTYLMCWPGASRYRGCDLSVAEGQEERHSLKP